MAITHICLLSEQPTPNICPLLDRRLRAEHVVFVVSPQQRGRRARFDPILARYHIGSSELFIADPYANLDAIQTVIEEEIDRQVTAGNEVLVNATAGTKPMAIAAHMAGYNRDVPVYYVNNDRVDWLFLPSGSSREAVELEERLKLPDFLTAFGFSSQIQKRNAQPEAEALLDDLLRSPTAYARGVRALNYHANRAERNGLRSRMEASDESNEPLQAALDLFYKHGLLRIEKKTIHFRDQSARFFCNGGWLEDHVLDALQGMRGELGHKLNDLQAGVEVTSITGQNRPVKNELDIAVLFNNTLHIIECKTKVFDQGSHEVNVDDAATDSLYKLATLRRELGGIRAKAMLVSYQVFKPQHRERAQLLDIELVAASELRELAPRLKNWLGVERTVR